MVPARFCIALVVALVGADAALVATAATSDDEQAQARARLLLQRAVEKVRAGVEQGVQGRAPS